MKIEVDLKITEGAIKEFKRALSEMGEEAATHLVRVSVQGGGCSGFMYGLGFVSPDEVGPTDIVEDYDRLKIAVDKKSALYLDGTTIDWMDDLSQRGFKFDNPNAKKTCGCNKSFSC